MSTSDPGALVPLNLKFGGGATDSAVHPAVLAATLVAVVLIIFLPRKRIISVLLPMMFLVPYGQQFMIGGFHVFVMRILILAGLARMASSRRGQWNSLDTLFVGWATCRAIAFVLLFGQMAAVVNQIGFLWDVLGGFLLLRFLIQDQDDVGRSIKVLAYVAIVLAASMANERLRGVNLFGYLGGGASVVSAVRDGSTRAQGPFAHALLAGTFGATVLPLFLWLWIGMKAKFLAVAGVLSSVIMTLAASASTPILTLGAGLFALCLWPMRSQLRSIRWIAGIGLAGVAVVMKAPVWFVLARIDLVGGSSGYHRALLIDKFVSHFTDWWLIGTNDNGNWGYDLWDTCNQYVTEGETGGLITLLCFLWILRICFQRLGRARRAASGDHKKEWLIWILGATLFNQVVAFFGIVYYDQTRMLWFLLLAVVVTITAAPRVVKPAPSDEMLAENDQLATVSYPALASSRYDPYSRADHHSLR